MAAGRVGDRRVSATTQRKWLESSKHWPYLCAPNWKPKRVLGAGTTGVCGLWDYVGDPAAHNGPRQVVVKQVSQGEYELEVEATVMRMIQDSSATEQVVKIYKGYHLDPGSGASKHFDPWPYDLYRNPLPAMDVARIYIDYCPGGDLDHKLRNLPAGQLWQEEELWRLLECMARELLVLEIGNEDPNAVPCPRRTGK
jgi:hypothetical protein